MAYGEIKVDTITFTDGGVDKSVTISGLVQNPTFSGNITVTGTISGNTVRGQTISGVTVTGTTAQFTSGTFTSINGGVATITSGVFASGSAAAPSVSVGTTTNGIYSPAANQVAIATSGTGRLFITPAGNVGIGTTSPSQLLHVSGNTLVGGSPAAQWSNFTVAGDSAIQAASPILNFVNAAGSARFGYINHAGTGGDLYLLNQEAGALRLGAGNTERLRIDSSGRLLVGTSSPYAVQGFNRSHYFAPLSGENNNQIVVSSVTTGTPAVFFTRTRGATPSTYTVVQDGDNLGLLEFFGADGTDYSASGARITCQVDGTPGDNDMPGRLVFSTTADGASSPTERMRIDNSGRLLVGTTGRSNFFNTGNTAGFQFEGQGGFGAFTRTDNDTFGAGLVFAKTRSSGNTIVQNNDTVGLLTFQGNDGSEFVECANIQALVDGVPGANDMPGRLTFCTTPDGGVTPVERMRITSGGNVGIGTSSPSELLHVSKSSLADGELAAIQITGGTRNLDFGVYKHAGISSPAAYFNYRQSNNTSALVWSDDTGVLRISSSASNIGTTGGTVVGSQTSDERVKNVHGPLEYGLDVVKQLEPIRYALKAAPDIEKIGFIAQQVLPLVPESVFDTKEEIESELEGAPTKLGMEYVSLIPVLVNAIKELAAELEALKARLTAAGI